MIKIKIKKILNFKFNKYSKKIRNKNAQQTIAQIISLKNIRLKNQLKVAKMKRKKNLRRKKVINNYIRKEKI